MYNNCVIRCNFYILCAFVHNIAHASMAETNNASMAETTHSDVACQCDQGKLVCDSILCFLWNKMDLIVHDTLVKLTCDYFDSNEIEASKRIVYQCDAVTSMELHPIRRRNGPNKDKNNIEDVLYVLHKCPNGLPTFVVSDLASLPPLDVNNVDFAHILGEIRALRAEMATLRTEVSSQHYRERSPSTTETQETQGGETTMPTRSDLQPPSDWMSERPILYTELPTQAGSSPAVTSEPGGAQPGGGRLSYAPVAARPSMHSGMHSSSSPMFAQFEGPVRGPVRRSVTPVVADADADGFTVVKRKRTATKPKAVIGTKCATTLKAKAGRFTAVFVSRLDPDTTEDDMERYVRETHNLKSTCSKLRSKHDSYASFKVEVFCQNLSDFYSPDKWPAGIYLRRFFNVAQS